MAVAFRSETHTTLANRNGGVTGSEPASAATDDIFRADLYIESDNAVTAPTGWSNSFNSTTALAEANNSGNEFRHYSYWIRRGGSAPSFAWTWTGTLFCGVLITAYSGALASGDPWSFLNPTVRDDTAGATYPNTSGTTSDANELLTWAGMTFSTPTNGIVPTSPAFTERVDAVTGYESGDVAQAGAGATGTVSGAQYGGGGNKPASSILAGLRPLAAGGSTRPVKMAGECGGFAGTSGGFAG